MVTYRKLQWIATAILVLMAIVHFTGIFVFPNVVITIVSGTLAFGFVSYQFYRSKKNETKEISKTTKRRTKLFYS